MWQRFTERARRVILLGQEEATKMSSGHVGTEHLLLGLVRENEGVAAQVLQKMGVSLEGLRQEVEAEVLAGSEGGPVEPKLTPKAKRVLELAADEARRMRHNYIGTEHLLLALLREENGVAAKVLNKLGLNLEKVRTEVLEYLGPESEETRVSRRIGGKPVRDKPDGSANFDVTPELQRVLELAADEARKMGCSSIAIEHILLTLLKQQNPLLLALLSETNFNEENARARIVQHLEEKLPPQEVRDLQRQLEDLNAAKEAAVNNDEYEKAANLRDQANEIEEKLRLALEAWQRSKETSPTATEGTDDKT